MSKNGQLESSDTLFICEDKHGLLDLLGVSAAGDNMPYACSKWTRVLRVDLNALPNAETVAAIEREAAGGEAATSEQHDEHAQYHEKQWLAHYSEIQRLRSDACPDEAIVKELVRLQRQVAGMQKVMDAAIAWSRALDPDPLSTIDRPAADMSRAVHAYRTQLASAEPVDSDRITWLDADPDRLEDVRGRINNEGVTVREAIDWFMKGTG